jgi:hypothetical protein
MEGPYFHAVAPAASGEEGRSRPLCHRPDAPAEGVCSDGPRDIIDLAYRHKTVAYTVTMLASFWRRVRTMEIRVIVVEWSVPSE